MKKLQHQSFKAITFLQDMVEGYRVQNQFLNKEVMEINQLRADDALREKSVFMYVHSLCGT